MVNCQLLVFFFTGKEDGRQYGIHMNSPSKNEHGTPKIGGLGRCVSFFQGGMIRFNVQFPGVFLCDCEVLSRASVLSEGRLQELSP